MNNDETQPETQALTLVREPAPMPLQQTPSSKPPTDAAQAKVDAVANLTMSAYQKASTLNLTPEEIKGLQADFPDSAFQPGAAGKEHLIYIEHAHLRDRLNQVIGVGQWSLVPRSRWAEPFTTQRGTEGSRVYVEAMLVIRGCFVAEAVGAMEYYPKNESQNYGDAVEGAKTAAFRRCAKELGVGLQAWKKEWCDAWWTRRRGGRDFSKKPSGKPEGSGPSGVSTPSIKPPETRQSAPAHLIPVPTEESRAKMIAQLKAGPNEPNRQIVAEYFQKLGQLLPTEELEDLPLRFCPGSVSQMRMLATRLAEFGNGGMAEPAFAPNEEKAPEKAPAKSKPAAKPVEVPREKDPAPSGEEWRQFPMPYGKNEGTPLEELPKKYLYGLWANYTVETEYRGKPLSDEQIADNETFRAMLDQAGEHYEFTKND